MPADYLGDLARRHALVGDGVEHRAAGTLLQRQAVQSGGIQPVARGPAIGPLADVAGHALAPGDLDQERDEPVIALAVDRGAGPHDRRADAALGHVLDHLFGTEPGVAARIGNVIFGHHVTGPDQRRPRSRDERPTAALAASSAAAASSERASPTA